MVRSENLRWVRSKNSWFAGVCRGLGEKFGIEVWILRLLWLVSFFWFGTGLLIYILLAISLPRQDRLNEAWDRRVFGVCRNISLKYNFEVGLVRFLSLLLALSSFGLFLVVYVGLAMFFPKQNSNVTEVLTDV